MSSFTCTFAAGRTECCNIIASVGLLPSYEKALLPSGHSRADGWNEAIGSIEIVISRPLQLTSDFDDYSHAVLSTLLSLVNHRTLPFPGQSVHGEIRSAVRRNCEDSIECDPEMDVETQGS